MISKKQRNNIKDFFLYRSPRLYFINKRAKELLNIILNNDYSSNKIIDFDCYNNYIKNNKNYNFSNSYQERLYHNFRLFLLGGSINFFNAKWDKEKLYFNKSMINFLNISFLNKINEFHHIAKDGEILEKYFITKDQLKDGLLNHNIFNKDKCLIRNKVISLLIKINKIKGVNYEI